MTHYSIVPRTTKYFKEFGFLLLARNLPKKYGKKLFNAVTKIGLNDLKNTFKKVKQLKQQEN